MRPHWLELARLTRLTLLCTLIAAGCFDFDDPKKVEDLRILAASAEPPETMVAFAPGSLESGTVFTVTADPPPVRVRILVVNPEAPDRPLHFTVRACPNDVTKRCDDAPTELVMSVVADGEGAPEEIVFDFAPSADQLNAWLLDDDFRGYGGLFVNLHIAITQDGHGAVHGSKIVTYNIPIVPARDDQPPPPPKTPNRNPRIDGLQVGDVVTRDTDSPIEVPAGASVEIEPIFDEIAVLQVYPVPSLPSSSSRQLGYEVLEELIQFEYYVTAGRLDHGTIVSRTPLGPIDDLSNGWKAPDTPPDEDVILWLIARDERGGSTWLRRVFRVAQFRVTQ